MKSCFFIGHEDDVPKHLEQRLESTVEQLIEELFVEEYVVADHYYHHQRLKEMLCRVLGRAKKRHPGLVLRLAIPHPSPLSPSLPPGLTRYTSPRNWKGCRPGRPTTGWTSCWWSRPPTLWHASPTSPGTATGPLPTPGAGPPGGNCSFSHSFDTNSAPNKKPPKTPGTRCRFAPT